jgi:C1A family cysteine protease
MSKYNLSYKFQPTDKRDYIFKAELSPCYKLEIAKTTIPLSNSITSVNTTVSPSKFTIKNTSPVLDQGNLGNCVSNAFSYCISCQTNNNISLSRLYHYAICRILDNTPLSQDNGTTVRTACSSIQKYGVVKESSYPYNTLLFSKLPSLSIIKNSSFFKKFTYTFLKQDITTIKNCLNTYNVPIIFGFLVFDSFMTNAVASTGIVPMPNTSKETSQGGHCMIIIGYDDTKSLFTCVNSWGTSWGNKGLCYIPYSYLLNKQLAADFCFTTVVN